MNSEFSRRARAAAEAAEKYSDKRSLREAFLDGYNAGSAHELENVEFYRREWESICAKYDYLQEEWQQEHTRKVDLDHECDRLKSEINKTKNKPIVASELTKRIHKLFTVVDRVAFIGHDLPSSTIRNDILILFINSVQELEKTNPQHEIINKLKVELEDIAP